MGGTFWQPAGTSALGNNTDQPFKVAGGSDMVNKGIKIVNEAIELDNAGKYQESLEKYQHAIEYLITGNKYEKNPQTKAMVTKKLKEYMERAEDVKKIIDNNGANPPSEGGVANKPAGKDVDDEEKKKRMANLGSAVVAEKP